MASNRSTSSAAFVGERESEKQWVTARRETGRENRDGSESGLAGSGVSPPPGPVSDPGQEGEFEVEQLLNRRRVRGVTRYLVRFRGHTSAADEWVRAEELRNCPALVAEYEAAALRRRHDDGSAPVVGPPGPAPALPAAAAPVPTPVAPPGFRLAETREVPPAPSLVGRQVLYWWPTDG